MKMIGFVLFLMLTGYLGGTELVPVPDISNPTTIDVSGGTVIISEGASIGIYTNDGAKKAIHFGKEGEGPQEFKLYPTGTGLAVKIFPEFLFINSLGKISYFTLSGEFIKESKTTVNKLIPIGKQFAGLKREFTNNSMSITFSLYDNNIKELKNICSFSLPTITSDNVTLIDNIANITPEMQTSGDRIYISGNQTFEIAIYDIKGDLKNLILQKGYHRLKINSLDKKKILEAYKNRRSFKLLWNQIKSAIKIPDTYPAFRTFVATDEKVYIQTFYKKIIKQNSRYLIHWESICLRSIFLWFTVIL